jgi:beta-N-acetylhexosaminidase
MARHGSLFLFGIEGKKPSRGSVSLLRDTGASGVLLLARNIDSPAQVRALASELVQRVGRPLLFSVDHEGGWVLRFKSGLTAFPGNDALGRGRDPKLAYATGRQMALELSALGINLNLAPVLDVATADYNPGIGIRSFGADPKLVGALGAAFVRGLQDHGVSACAKHFPGKGAATKDAHVELPVIRLPRGDFERVHLAPFAAAVAAGVDCVMTSHVLYPALDKTPATFSPRITRVILRDRLGFGGVVISDDLCMGAVAGREPIQTAAVKAIQAGHDLLIVAHGEQTQREAAELLEQAASDGAVSAEDLASAEGRVASLLGRRRHSGGGCVSASAGARLAARVAREAVEPLR